MKTVLVTGGAGFIGSHLVDQLIKDGFNVRVLDNLSTGKLTNIQMHLASGKVDFVCGDIRDAAVSQKAIKNVNFVVHLAAVTSVPLSLEDPETTFDVNLIGTLNLLRSSIKEGISRFVFVSSCAVCGNPKSLPVIEETPPNPISPYAESKLMGERYCLGFYERQLIDCVALRFFNVYGSCQGLNEYSGVITCFIDRCREGLPLTIYGDGSQTRDFVNIKDTVDAISASMKETRAEGQIFNIGSGKATSINELAKMIIDLSSTDLKINYENQRAGDIRDSFADISKARSFLGYEPRVSLKDGLRELIENEAVAD